MKRVVMLLAVGVLILGSALSALAQAPAGPTVSFGGQMRVYGFAFDNIYDFKDSKGGDFRDSQSFYFQRFRLFTTIESADKKAKAYWALEIGDMVWGAGGGAASDLYGCQGDAPGIAISGVAGATANPSSGSTRVNRGAGGCAGNDGVNVETKNLYIWFQVPGVENASLLLGLHNILFMTTNLGALMDDDAAGIQFNWKLDPVDVQLSAIKLSEGFGTGVGGTPVCNAGRVGSTSTNNCLSNADDSDMYVARVGINVAKDIRVTVEGMVIDQRGLAGQSFGDTFWVGATASAKIGDIVVDGAFVYGQRAVAAAAVSNCGNATNPCQESGYGIFASARIPVGPVSVFASGWYTTGDNTIGPATTVNTAPGVTSGGSGGATIPGPLVNDSDKLPLPLGGAGYNAGPYIAEWLFGNVLVGSPGIGQRQYNDPTGTYGIGASATYALTPQLSVGGGVGFVGATDAKGPYGDSLIEIDAGIVYRLNANLTITGFAGYMIPDTGDPAWGALFRTQYSF
jgi:hypothetical protein